MKKNMHGLFLIFIIMNSVFLTSCSSYDNATTESQDNVVSEKPSAETTEEISDNDETAETDTDTSASEEGDWGEASEMEAEDITISDDQIILDNLFLYKHVNGKGKETDRVGYVLFEYEMLGFVKYQVAYLACT
ncbi:MAG: hypothetical protein ACK5LV_04685 [Lachnospirales bacterium]